MLHVFMAHSVQECHMPVRGSTAVSRLSYGTRPITADKLLTENQSRKLKHSVCILGLCNAYVMLLYNP